LPKAKGKTDSNKNVSVTINKNLAFFIDKDPVEETNLENALIAIMGSAENKAVVLRAEKSVPHEKVIYVMDIAYRNGLKMVVAVNPK